MSVKAMIMVSCGYIWRKYCWYCRPLSVRSLMSRRVVGLSCLWSAGLVCITAVHTITADPLLVPDRKDSYRRVVLSSYLAPSKIPEQYGCWFCFDHLWGKAVFSDNDELAEMFASIKLGGGWEKLSSPYKGGRNGDPDSRGQDNTSPGRGNAGHLPLNIKKLRGESQKNGMFSKDIPGFFYFIEGLDFHWQWPGSESERESRPGKTVFVSVAPELSDLNASSPEVQLTSHSPETNLSIIQLALFTGGFSISSNLYDQLLSISDMRLVELEQLANTLENLALSTSELAESGTVHTEDLAIPVVAELLIQIEQIIQALIRVRLHLKQEDDPTLVSIRRNLVSALEARLFSQIAYTHQVMLPGQDTVEREALILSLLDLDPDELDKPEDIGTLQNELDELLASANPDCVSAKAVEILKYKIEAIKRLIDRKEESLSRRAINGSSWWRALKNRLDTLEVELQEANHRLVIEKSVTEYLIPREPFPEPCDMEKEEKKTSNPDNSGKNAAGGEKEEWSSRKAGDTRDEPPEKQKDNDGSGDEERGKDNDPQDERVSDNFDLDKESLDMALWLAERMREYSAHDERQLPDYSAALGHMIRRSLSSTYIDNIKEKLDRLFAEQYPAHQSLLVSESDDENDIAQYILATFKVMRGVHLATVFLEVVPYQQLKELRKQFNQYVGGVEKSSDNKGLSRQPTIKGRKSEIVNQPDEPVEFRDQSSWSISIKQDEKDMLEDGHKHQAVVNRVSTLPLSRILNGSAEHNGYIVFTQEEAEEAASGFRSDAERFPVVIEYVRVGTRAGRAVKERTYQFYDARETARHLQERFAADTAGSGVIKISRFGGIEDSLQLLFKNRPDVLVLFHKLLSQEMGNVPRSVFFGGTDGGSRVQEGVLTRLGMPGLNPTNTDQTDPKTQNIRLVIYSNGRIGYKYHVEYNQVALDDGVNAVKFGGGFIIDLELEFAVEEGGVRKSYSELSYTGSFDKLTDFNKKAKEIEKAEIRKKIERVNKAIEVVSLGGSEYQVLPWREPGEIEHDETREKEIDAWRGAWQLNSLRHALTSFQTWLDPGYIALIENHPVYIRVLAKLMDEAFVHGLKQQFSEFLRRERESYEYSKSARRLVSEHRAEEGGEDLFSTFEAHKEYRERLISYREDIQEYEAESMSCISKPEALKVRAKLESLIEKIQEEDASYNQNGGELFQMRRRLINSPLYSAFDVFKPCSVIQSGVLFEARLLIDKIHKTINRFEVVPRKIKRARSYGDILDETHSPAESDDPSVAKKKLTVYGSQSQLNRIDDSGTRPAGYSRQSSVSSTNRMWILSLATNLVRKVWTSRSSIDSSSISGASHLASRENIISAPPFEQIKPMYKRTSSYDVMTASDITETCPAESTNKHMYKTYRKVFSHGDLQDIKSNTENTVPEIRIKRPDIVTSSDRRMLSSRDMLEDSIDKPFSSTVRHRTRPSHSYVLNRPRRTKTSPATKAVAEKGSSVSTRVVSFSEFLYRPFDSSGNPQKGLIDALYFRITQKEISVDEFAIQLIPLYAQIKKDGDPEYDHLVYENTKTGLRQALESYFRSSGSTSGSLAGDLNNIFGEEVYKQLWEDIPDD